MKKMIDISHHNKYLGEILNMIQGFFPDAVIIRAGYGTHFDKKVTRNIEDAEINNIPYVLYWYSYADNPQEAEEEAKIFYNAIIANSWEPLAVAYDMEGDTYKEENKITINKWADIADTFCNYIERQAYYTMIYANVDDLREMAKKSGTGVFKRHAVWCANWQNGAQYEELSKMGYKTSKMKALLEDYPDINIMIWQFTNGIYFNGESYPIDGDVMEDTNFQRIKDFSHGKLEDNDIRKGDFVEVKTQIDYNGVKNDQWVLYSIFNVYEIKGDRVVIGTSSGITGAWKKSDLKKVKV